MAGSCCRLHSQDPISLQEPLYNKDGTDNIFVMDQIRDNKNIDERWVEDLTIAQAMTKLNKRETKLFETKVYVTL